MNRENHTTTLPTRDYEEMLELIKKRAPSSTEKLLAGLLKYTILHCGLKVIPLSGKYMATYGGKRYCIEYNEHEEGIRIKEEKG